MTSNSTDTSTTTEDRQALIDLHDWDLLIFGGFYCMHCTPEDADEVTPWPCPPLRDAGMTDDEANEIIQADGAAK